MKTALGILGIIALVLLAGAGPALGGEEYLQANCFKCGKLFRVTIQEKESVVVTCPHCGQKVKIKMPEPKVIAWEKANKYIGKEKIIEGTIVGTHKSSRSNNVYLNLNQDWRTRGSVAIKSSDLSKFDPNPEVYFQGKKVRVTGKIVEDKGTPRIWLTDPSQIEVLK